MSHSSTICRQLLSLSLLAGFAAPALAQTTPADTARLSYDEETVLTPTIPADTVLRVQHEDRSLWKLALNDFTLSANRTKPWNFYTRYGLPIAYERRLQKPEWSVMVEVNPGLIRYRPAEGASLKRGVEVQTVVAGRYYYNLERRLRLGRNITHFSGNYVSVAFRNQVGPQLSYTGVAVLYGLQRRLGRYGFLDFSLGPGGRIANQRFEYAPGGTFLIGLAVGSWPAAPYRARVVPVNEEQTLRPKAYAGVQFGAYMYQTNHQSTDPYRTPPSHWNTFLQRDSLGVGKYNLLYNRPYIYGGYFVSRRLAVQVGVQQAYVTDTRNTWDFQRDSLSGVARERGIAFPVLMRYSLTGPFLKRLQFDALVGLVPAWSAVRYREQRFNRGEFTGNYGFDRRSFGLHATGGLNLSYGMGRRRRIQAVGEMMFTKPLLSASEHNENLQAGLSAGLRYRFGYR